MTSADVRPYELIVCFPNCSSKPGPSPKESDLFVDLFGGSGVESVQCCCPGPFLFFSPFSAFSSKHCHRSVTSHELTGNRCPSKFTHLDSKRPLTPRPPSHMRSKTFPMRPPRVTPPKDSDDLILEMRILVFEVLGGSGLRAG